MTPRSYLVASSTGEVLRRNCCHLRSTDEPFELPVPSNEVPEDIPVVDSHSEELITSSSSTSLTVLVFPLRLLVKQTLLQLQFLLLCADQLGELKLQKDWTYDCMYCLVFFLYEELEQFNISNASSFLSFSQEGDVILLTGLRSSTIVQGINCVNLFIYEILLLALMVVVKADLLLPYVF